jgi:predicted RecB family nuclease
MDDIAPQGGYLAKRCPQAVQLDVLRPCEPLPDSPFMTMLAEGGIAFEVSVFDAMAAAIADSVRIDKNRSRAEREELTLRAMAEGAPVILGGRLPADHLAHRVGEPDVLLRATVEDQSPVPGPAYLPVDVKHHRTLTIGSSENSALTSELREPYRAAAIFAEDEVAHMRRSDLLQLAHYQRMLEECGRASSYGRWAGIIGREAKVVWYDLDRAAWLPSGYFGDPSPELLSTMELYDAEFAHRLAVIGASLEHRVDPASPLLAEPIAVPDCGECGWQPWCFGQMEESGDLSLLPRMSIAKRRTYHAHGVVTMRELASLDSRTARLISAGVDLRHFQEKAALSDRSTPAVDLLSRRPTQARLLAAEGIVTAGDATAIDERTARFDSSGIRNLAQQIDNARARTGSSPAYRRRGIDEVLVPRADIEIDVDMENVADGCYLWGTLTTGDTGVGRAQSEFVPFVSWDPDTESGEIEAFLSFWEWLQAIRSYADGAGLLLRAYCYSEGAENGQMRRVAARCELQDDVEAFLCSDQWVDLLPIVRSQLITGRGMGLKTVATVADFHWRGAEVGGALAMVQYVQATSQVDDLERAEARRWILDYNEDDVRATAALRHWLSDCASTLPSIEDVRLAE